MLNVTPFTGTAASQLTVAIPSVTAGSTLFVVSGKGTTQIGSIIGNPGTVAFRGRLGQSYTNGFLTTFSLVNAPAGLTSLNINYSGTQTHTGYIFELQTPVPTCDPLDRVSSLDNSTATNLGNCGSAIGPPRFAGIALSVFIDFLGSATAYAAGSGWTAGTTIDNACFWQYSDAYTGTYGGSTNQATVTGPGDVVGLIQLISSGYTGIISYIGA